MKRRLMEHFEIKGGDNSRVPENNFHAIRYLLALAVLYSHSYGLLALPEPGIFLYTFGALAVKCFFALSGYLIARSCLRTANLRHYAWNRILRILPALIVALIASYYVASYFDHFINNPVPYINNGPIWTLFWEMFCYGICGLLWWLGLLRVSSLGAIVAVSWLLYIVLPTTSETALIIAPLVMLFFLGAYIAINKKNLDLTIAGPFFFGLLILASIDTDYVSLTWLLNNVPFLYGPNMPIHEYQTLIFLFSLPFFLIWLAYQKPFIILKNDYSYGMYIFAWPIQQVIVSTMSPSPLILFAVSWATTHCIAMLSWHLIEKNVLKFKV